MRRPIAILASSGTYLLCASDILGLKLSDDFNHGLLGQITRVQSDLRSIRREFAIMHLRAGLERARHAVFGPDRVEVENLRQVLDAEPEKLSDESLRILCAATAKKVASLPPQSRSLQIPVMTRAVGTSRVVTFVASTDGLDRHGTKILPMGISTERFEQNPICLWGHDGYGGWGVPRPENVIGKALRLRKSEKRLEADIEFLPASVNPNAEMVLGMVRAGAVSAVSIGFVPREVRTEIDANGREVPVIVKSELLEISVVPIPSNPDALATGRTN